MAISNEDALSNLVQQKETLMTELASGQRNLLKLEGAIEVLEQLVQENQVQPESPVDFNFEGPEVDEVTGEPETTEE